jgi:hypothetical protein
LRPDVDLTEVPEHARRMIRTCLTLADASGELLALRRWAHMLGFGGHFLTKSRAYSVTFTQLRAARTEYQAADARQRDGLPDTALLLNHWTYTAQTDWRTNTRPMPLNRKESG